MKNTDTSIDIFSPLRKEEWKYEAEGFSFSSLDHQILVVDTVGVDWSTYQSVLLSCVEATATLGFFRVTPWFPGRRSLRDALLSLFPNCKADGFSVFGYFGPTSRNLELIFNLWQERGGSAGGEWQIGGCLDEFQEPIFETAYGGLDYFLRAIHNVGCVLSLEEMQQSTLLTSQFNGLTERLEILIAGEI